jgi:hypothetical protein
MACKKLAAKYASNHTPIPSTDTDIQTRMDWLLTQKWGCVHDGEVHYGTTCEEDDRTYMSHDPSKHLSKTRLKESGFLHWVNTRGMQCINKLTGVINTLPDRDGKYQIPGQDVEYPKTYCSGQCYNANPDSETCFECIKETLETNDDIVHLCPDLYDGSKIKKVDVDLIKSSLECHSCIAQKSKNLQISTVAHDPNCTTTDVHHNSIQVPGGCDVYTTTVNPVAFENIWGCITGDFPVVWSTGGIIGVVILCLLVIVRIGVMVKYYYSNQSKQKTKEDIDILKSYGKKP